MTLSPQRISFLLLITGILLVCGCSFQRTAWHTRGRFTAEVKEIDGTYSRINKNIGMPREHRGRIRFSDEQALALSLSSSLNQPGAPASITVVIGESLDEIGVHEIIGGFVNVWSDADRDGTTTPPVRSEDWTISGTVEITNSEQVAPPPKRVGSKNIVETLAGVINLVVKHTNGDQVVVRDGVFEIRVEASRYNWDPS